MKYFALAQNERTADITIYGDITSWDWTESDVSSYTLSKQIADLDVDVINVHINSYGGEVAEGLAIYNSLKNHKAKVKTIVDGFACSSASVIFMAGDERIMNNASLLMIHNAWTYAGGNSAELRKTADDLDKITQAIKNAYLDNASITAEELTALLDEETWLLPQDALDKGFSTGTVGVATVENKAVANTRKTLFNLLTGALAENTSVSTLEQTPQSITSTISLNKTGFFIKAEPEPAPALAPQPQNKIKNILNALTGEKE